MTTPDEICERLLRWASAHATSNCAMAYDLREAADRIQQQRAEIERLSAEKAELREALQLIADGWKFDDPVNRLQIVRGRARVALGKDVKE